MYVQRKEKKVQADDKQPQTLITDYQTSSDDDKYNRNYPRQKIITNAIMEMIIRDIIPTHIVEKPGFRNLILLLEPKYTMVSRQCLQYTLVPEKVQIVQQSIKDQLEDVKSFSVTLDIWSSRRMHGYLGITCHFVSSNWQIKSFLLCCKQIKGRHTGDSISLEYESVTEEYGITTKVFKVITDNASNMIKAFGPMIKQFLSNNILAFTILLPTFKCFMKLEVTLTCPLISFLHSLQNALTFLVLESSE